jgi:hypothetical protein
MAQGFSRTEQAMELKIHVCMLAEKADFRKYMFQVFLSVTGIARFHHAIIYFLLKCSTKNPGSIRFLTQNITTSGISQGCKR